MAAMTITTSAQEAAAIAQSLGAKLALGRDATPAEVKADIIVYWKTMVADQQRAAAAAAVVPTTLSPT